MSTPIRVCLTGHVDSGKSTLAGHLLYKLGVYSDDDFRLAERQAAENKLPTWKYSYLLDIFADEQTKGKTKDFSEILFSYTKEDKTNSYTLIDTPGHERLIRVMIEGATSTDVGIFVVSCKSSEFANSLNDTEHLALLKCIGASQLIVVMNKWDLVDIVEARDMQKQIAKLVSKFGYKNAKFCFVSAYNGYNLVEHHTEYSSSSLMDILFDLEIKQIEPDKPTEPMDEFKIQGFVMGSKLISAGYSCMLHSGRSCTMAEITKVDVNGRPYAKKDDKCIITVKIPNKTSFDVKRLIIRDGDNTIFLGILV
jgi:elongation factor 1-alpha